MTRYIPVIALMLALSGCAGFDAGKAVALDKGTQVADEALKLAILGKCRLPTAGALTRHYMVNAATWKLWTDECLGVGADRILLPVPK